MKLRLLAGALALDFVNTVDPLVGPDAQEFLDRPEALVDWARLAGLDPPPAPTAADLRRALDVRRDLYAVFWAVSALAEPPADALERVHATYAEALTRARLVPSGEGYAWRPARADAVLWPVLASAVELLTSGALDRVKECENHEACGWLFLDTSRSGTRRWCSMSGCGSRAKMRRYRARQAASTS
jgi:predicted RNA-binding Zn ribbon-like protein